MRRINLFWLATVIVMWAANPFSASAEVRLPNVFADHMVLQRDMPITIWGWAQPNETLSVTLGSITAEVSANERGEWKIIFPAMKAGGPFTLKVAGSSTLEFHDVLIGEVWLCSGQSNMEFGIGIANDAEKEIAKANDPQLRLLLVDRKWSPSPQTNIGGEWKLCSSNTVVEGGWSGFSAAAYFFGRELRQKLGVPIGLIESSWGGTRIESWTPPEGYAATPALSNEYQLVELADPTTSQHYDRLKQVLAQEQQWLDSARTAMENHAMVPTIPAYPEELLAPHDLQNPTALYNGCIHPLIPYSIRGALWYQGESNMGEGMHYAERMMALIRGWRTLWGEGDFPFYFVQIAPYNYGGKPQTEAELWEAQATAAREIPNTGMAVINDIGDLKNIHPKNKQDVGHRLALLALAGTYDEKNVIASGPTFKSMEIEDSRLRVDFDHADGLHSRDGKPLDWFEIMDADEGGFVKADAQIDGSSVVLSALRVRHPAAMRFAWSMLAEPNLVNSAGLPTGAFRAGSVPKRDLLKEIAEAKQYKLVYDLDLGKLGSNIRYDVDNHENIPQQFDRIAYFVELQKKGDDPVYLYVSMDAFTHDMSKIGVPTVSSHEHYQQNVANMDVFSNVQGIKTGVGMTGGNIEFWPNNYSPANGSHVPNASNDAFDFGDQPNDPENGYGSMQVHNHDAKQTLFAINHWSEGSKADIGIGNQPKGFPDWTFSSNAGTYEAKRLRILVRCNP
ncbi:MAG TPA: sialate O-acetylesterase [Verrucomicrobiae bacterium]